MNKNRTNHKKEPLYYQLYLSMARDIEQGVYKENEKMPSKRSLSDHLGVSQNTVDTAYQMLVTEGYLRAVARSGFYVNPVQKPLLPKQLHPPPSAPNTHTPEPAWRYNLSTNFADAQSFPFATWAKLTKEVMYEQPNLLNAGHPQGDLCLRQAIADYLHKYRAVNCTAEQVLVGAGMEYLLMILNVLFERNSTFAMETPGYPKVYQTVTNCGRAVIPIPVTKTGIDISSLQKSGANLVYITPSHQFPTGVVMPIGKRIELLHWANSAPNRFIIEDDYDSELKYTGKPIPSLQGIDSAGKVAYIGTFSRSIARSVRIAYLVLPKALLEKYSTTCSHYASTVSRFEQHTLFRFITGGHFERHINRNRNTYRKRREALVCALKNAFPAESIELLGANAGLHIPVHIKNGMSETELIDHAKQAKICLNGISPYYIKNTLPQKSTVLLGFARHSPEQLEQAAYALAAAWRKT